MKQTFDLDTLKEIPIEDVLEMLGARFVGGKKGYRNTFAMHCFCGHHEHGDKNPSLIVWKKTNICKCMVNPNLAGDNINVVKNTLFNGDFKQACVWLHENFNIPYIDEEDDYYKDFDIENIRKAHIQIQVQKPKKQTCNLYKELNKPFHKIDINKFITKEKLSTLNSAQRLKLIYTYIYRYSLTTNQTKKQTFYKSRYIENHPLIDYIGFLSKDDISFLIPLLKNIFDIEDLIKVKVLNNKEHKYSLQFRYYTKDGFCVIPNGFELSNDLINGFILRPIKPVGKIKEFQVSVPNIVLPLPFGLGKKSLLKKDIFFISEGHIDALSIPSEIRKKAGIIAVPGVGNVKEEWICLLKNKKVIIAFDMDKAGEEGANRTFEMLKELNIESSILKWDTSLGKDLNELKKCNNILKVFEKKD